MSLDDAERLLSRYYEDLLTQIMVAVGRVAVLEGQPISGFEMLPSVVSMVVADHEDLERRIDAIVEYLRDLGPDADEQLTVEVLRQRVGRLLQGAEPQIIDLEARANECKEE